MSGNNIAATQPGASEKSITGNRVGCKTKDVWPHVTPYDAILNTDGYGSGLGTPTPDMGCHEKSTVTRFMNLQKEPMFDVKAATNSQNVFGSKWHISRAFGFTAALP